MSIVALTADGEEQISRRERARINGVSRCRLLQRVALPRPELPRILIPDEPRAVLLEADPQIQLINIRGVGYKLVW